MATATCELAEDQLLCCICLEVFTDPVTTPCGHNFCKKCLYQHWNDTIVYKCPYCKQAFHPRPELKVNIFICEMAQQFRSRAMGPSVLKMAAPGEVGCDFCPEPRLKALKSCLVCLSSFCELHLQPHLSLPGLKGHQLSQPLKDLSERVCKEHNKPLELFCPRDQCCVCVICMHQGHDRHKVLPLKNGCEHQLEKKTVDIQMMIKRKEAKIQELRCSVEANNKEADTQISNVRKIFMALKESVDRRLEKHIQDINKKTTAVEQQVKGYIAEIQQEISDLQRRRCELKQLSQSEDHFHALKNISQLHSPPETKDWATVKVYQPRYKYNVVRTLSDLEQDFIKNTKHLFEEDLRSVRSLYMKSVELDCKTAHPQLTVSKDCTEVQSSSEQNIVEDSPTRFDIGLYVLGTKSFSDTFYYEALVRGKSEWTLGVAQESVNRKGHITLNPENGFWTISFKNKKIYASADTDVCLLTKLKPEKVGVFVNYQEGIVSFYDAGANDLIFYFTDCSFRESLYPFCSPGINSNENSANLVMCTHFRYFPFKNKGYLNKKRFKQLNVN